DAEPVPRDEESLLEIVPDREREDPVEAGQHRGAVHREHPQEHFGVTVRREPLACRLELPAELPEVVELAVVCEPPAVGEAHRLRAGRSRVDDREAPVAQPGGWTSGEEAYAAPVR